MSPQLVLKCRWVAGNVVFTDAGWSSSVARRAHNPEVAGSNPVPATSRLDPVPEGIGSFLYAGMNGAGIHPRSTS